MDRGSRNSYRLGISQNDIDSEALKAWDDERELAQYGRQISRERERPVNLTAKIEDYIRTYL